jgi:methionyl-tRNA formyltransferase
MIVIAGKNNIAVGAVEYLIQNKFNDIAVVCNQTDNGVDGWQRSLHNFAFKNNVKIIDLQQAYKISDIFISLEFDKIVKPELFKNPYFFNIHFSDLPKYKGMYTSVHPILNGEKSGGVTLHEIDVGIDTGDIYDQIIFPIQSAYRARDLYREYLHNSHKLFVKNIKQILQGGLIKKPQDWKASTYYSKNSINFNSIDLDVNQTAANIIRQVYAYSFRDYQLPKFLNKKIVEAVALDAKSRKKPGTLLSESVNSLVISTIDCDLELYFDGIDSLHRFSICNEGEASSLLRNLAGVNDRNNKGWSPLIVAAYNGNHRVVNFLLERGALVNDENYNGTSVLMYAKDFALKTKNKTIFNRLIEVGADVEKKDFYGKCLRDYLTVSEENFLGL